MLVTNLMIQANKQGELFIKKKIYLLRLALLLFILFILFIHGDRKVYIYTEL